MESKIVKAILDIKFIEGIPIADQFDVMYFDKDIENWTFINQANKIGEFWETEITNFGNLIWADPVKAQLIEVKVNDIIGVPMKNIQLYVQTGNANPASLFRTDNLGIGRGYAPIGKEFSILTFQYCQEPLIRNDYSSIFESEETLILNDFEMTSNAQVYRYEGSLEDCTGNPIPFGILELTQTYYPINIIADENGNFDGGLLDCFGPFEARVYNPATNKYSDVYSFEGQDEEDYDLGTLMVCE